MTAADVDRDGDQDLYVCRKAFPNQLFINDGNGVFTESGAAFGVDYFGWSICASFGDFDRLIDHGLSWILRCQNEDGGWGELPLSYDDATHKGRGPSTPSQTAWAILGLMAAGQSRNRQIRSGVEFLLREQHKDGSWEEEYWTGTGFPGVFYLRYHLYGTYFPLLALSHFAQHATGRFDLTRP